MRRLATFFCLLFALVSTAAHALDLNSTYYGVYEKPGTNGQTIIYIVPKPSVLILASDPITPITFMPNFPAYVMVIDSSGNFVSIAQSGTNYTSNDMAGLGATASSYKLFSGDFDGDGRSDFLVQGSGTRASVVLSTDPSSGGIAKYYDFKNTLDSGSVSIAISDVDGNGRSDVIANGGANTYLASSYGAWFDSSDRLAGLSINYVGATAGKFRVDEQGDATYGIDILSAPGTAGVAPHISLNYSSGGGNGIAGQGWSLGGLSAISRCRQTLSQDNKVRGIAFTAEDRFCLDGQRLILASGTYGSAGSTYRTEIDSYALVTAYGGSAGSPAYFAVQRKDGSLSYFGNGNGSQQMVGSNVMTWAISSFQDSVGNGIKFSYLDGGAGHRVDRIDYAFGATGIPVNSSTTYIKFDYEVRPDPSSGYIAGNAIANTQRLAAIHTYGSGTELRTYNLIYQSPSTTNGKSVVAKLFECVGSNCMSPTQFVWASPQNGFVASTTAASIVGQVAGVKFADVNGDGKQDITYIAGSGSTWNIYVRLSNGAGFDSPSLVGAVDGADANFSLIDINNDGKQDLVFGRANQNWQVAFGSSSGFMSAVSLGFGYNKNAQFVDIDSDGLVDCIYPIDVVTNGIHSHDWRFRRLLRTASSGVFTYAFGGETAATLSDPAGSAYGLTYLTYAYGSPIVADFNGDGRLDIVAYQTLPIPDSGTANMRAFTAADNNVFVAGSFLTTGNSTVMPIDLNSDGLPDLMYGQQYMGQPSLTWKYRLNTGVPTAVGDTSGDVTIGLLTNDKFTFGDYNNDGYADLIYPANGALQVRYYQPASSNYAAAVSTGIAIGDPTKEQYQFTDIDGDGHPDLIRTVFDGTNSSVYLYKSLDAGRVTQRITSIDNGLGNVTTINYKPLTDSSVYTVASDANTATWPAGSDYAAKPFPVFDLLAADYVVSSVSSTAPAANANLPGNVNYGATSRVDYKYAGAKAQASGRGMLGFASIMTTDSQSRVITTTTYRQDFPFIGQPISTTVQTASDNQDVANRLLKQSNNHASSISHPGADGTTYYQLYTDKVTEATFDLMYGSEIGYVVTTTAQPDDWGNVPSITANSYASNDHTNFLKQVATINTYGSTTYDKQFGRLSRTVVTHKRAGYADMTRTSAFNYYTSGAQQGLLYQEIIEPDNSALTITTQYAYDGFGNKTRITKKAAVMTDRYTNISYDSLGRYPVTTNSPFCSAYTAGTSNCSSWVDQVTENVVSRNAFGSPTQINGLNGIQTTIQYDSLGREKSRSDNTGASVTTTYSRGGQIGGAQYQIRTQSNTGSVTTDSFDALGRSIAKTQTGFDGRTIQAETEYDFLSRIQRQSQPHFSGYSTYWTTNTYDTLGRLKAQTAPIAGGGTGSSSFAYEAVTLTGGSIGTRTTITNALNQTRKEFRNAIGELIEVDDYLGGMVGFGYDALGQLVRTSNIGGATTIPTDLTYDQLGRKIKMVDAEKGTWFYEYNPFGELINQYKVVSSTVYSGTLAQAKAVGSGVSLQITHMDYDLRGRMIARSDTRENGTVEGTATWIYDTGTNGIGQLAQENGGGLTRNYSYDNLGRVNGTTHSDDSGTYMLTASYDSFGRPLSQTDMLGTGSGTTNSYNSYGYLQSITDIATNTVLYQAANADQYGHTVSAQLGNGGTSTWTYDDATGLLLNQRAVVGLYTLVDLTYTWDAIGNQTSRTDKGMIAASPGTYRNLQQSFCYDGLNRLIKTASTAYSASYCNSLTTANQDQQYDAFGNITYKTGIGGYTYGNSSKPHTLTATGDGVAYIYDNTGNLTSDTGGRMLTYSVFEKPLTVSKGTDTVSFTYGPDRSYYKRTDVKAGVTTRTYHIGGVEKVIKSDNSYDIKRYIGGVAIWTHHFNASGAQTSLDKQFTYKDVLGSIVLITDGIGGIKGQMAFDEWGKRVSYQDWRTDQSATYAALQVSQLFTTQGYTGHDMLDEVGLIHMQGRIYDARLGRFVQADPVVQDAEDLQAYNRYAYVRNNPLTLTDPSGFSWWGKHVGKHWKHVWGAVKPFVGMVVTAVLIYCGQYWAAAAFNAAWTKANGGTWSDALIAGVSTYAFAQFAPGGAFSGMDKMAQVLTSGAIGGVMSSLQGGSFGNGFISAGLGAMAGMSGVQNVAGQYLVAAAVGGTASVLTGGKFENGAIGAAMGYAAGQLAGKIYGMSQQSAYSEEVTATRSGDTNGPGKNGEISGEVVNKLAEKLELPDGDYTARFATKKEIEAVTGGKPAWGTVDVKNGYEILIDNSLSGKMSGTRFLQTISEEMVHVWQLRSGYVQLLPSAPVNRFAIESEATGWVMSKASVLGLKTSSTDYRDYSQVHNDWEKKWKNASN